MITIGNDEFILYIRKRYIDCRLDNDTLGKHIWQRIKSLDSNAVQTGRITCCWAEMFNLTEELRLPKTAQQLQFDRSILPEIYNYLDELGQHH